MSRLPALVAAAAALLCCLSLRADVPGWMPWMQSGPAGTIDPDFDQSWVDTGRDHITTSASCPNGTMLVVRYPVTPTPGMFGSSNKYLGLRFKDDSVSAERIQLILRELDPYTGAVRTLMTLDTDKYAPSSAYQTKWVSSGYNPGWDFTDKVYYVDAYETFMQSRGPGNTTGRFAQG